ncbi:MAG: LPS export ABC transporter permease LptF [Gammaproteobacteria bacterium RIFCSPLOWO2_12_FULL_52_10]|nr:MAG: LPS export ABC transporter permease LptF [Gammaproteobacteria bacterium RIFCSPLOWO2_12_FULL_52_10]
MILERYIHREVLEKLMWILGLLVLILTSHRFVDFLADAAAGRIPGDLILSMLLMKMLSLFPRLLPAAVFLAVILAWTRLAGDKELLIMTGAGVSVTQQLLYVFKFAFTFAIFVFFVSNFVSPWAENRVEQLKLRARQESDIAGLSSGRFKEFSSGGRVVYVQELSADRQQMQKVFLQVREASRFGVLSSDSARFHRDQATDSRYVLFENGHRYLGKPGQADYQITDYRAYAVLLDQGKITADKRQPESIPSFELFGSNEPEHIAELQWRASFVIATLLLPLFAVLLNKFSFGDNAYVSLMAGILVYFVYSNLISISKTLLRREDIPAFIGIWWAHLLLALIIAAVFWLQIRAHRRSKRDGQQLLPAQR